MRPALLLLCVFGAGCSFLFDPAQVAPRACPASAAACPVLANASAACEQETCRYSCASGFVDGNGDLELAQGDGCELSCGGGTAPENPAALTATVGAKGGAIDWSFPASATSGVVRYRLCTATPGAAEVCLPVEPATGCPMGLCAATTEGHVDGLRVTGRVLSVDACMREGSAATAPTVSATPLDTSNPALWVLEKSCAGSTSSVVGGQLAIENPMATCASSLVSGDELWGDLTIDADLRFSTGSDTMAAGLALQSNATGHRLGALVAPASSSSNELAFFTQRKNGVEKVVAASGRGASFTSLNHLRVVSKGGVNSFSFGPDAARLQEVLRWPDTARTGRVGLGCAGAGRMELTNLRVSTASALPPQGATASQLDLSDGGIPAGVRQLGMVRVVGCPALPPSARCDGGCLPSPGANCVRINSVFSNQGLVVDLPVGIDVRAPYSLSMRFAVAPDGGGLFPAPLNTPQGGLLSAFNWAGTTRGLGQEYGVALEPGAWHAADFRFDADAGVFSVRLDEQPVPLTSAPFPVPMQSPHLGPVSVGQGTASDIFVSELRVSQP